MYYLYRKEKLSNYNALKAISDAYQILERFGYQRVSVGGNNGFTKILSIIKLFFGLKKGEALFVQIPTYGIIDLLLYFIITLKKQKTEILIHDLRSIRFNSKSAIVEENYLLKRADKIIVHTEAMRDVLIGRGVKPDVIFILHLFDYLTLYRNNLKRSADCEIVYAGNLEKSEFLRDLPQFDMKFILYGAFSNILNGINERANGCIEYAGKFKSEDISQIKGNWGLVWDGTSCDTCSGLFGEYLRYNSPHKLSLYIAAEIPVIVWSKSALSDFIVKHKLGISVNNIAEIKQKIMDLGESDYIAIMESVKQYSACLRNGKNLMTILETINEV